MKQKNLLNQLFLLVLALFIGGVGSAWGEEVLFYTLDGTNTSSGGSSNYSEAGNDVVQDGMHWAAIANCTQNPWRVGGKNLSGEDREIYSKTAMDSKISKVVVAVGEASSITVNSIKLIVASDDEFTNVIDEVTETFAANSDIEFTPTAPETEWATNAYYKLVFNVTNTSNSNRFVQFKSAKFYTNTSGPYVTAPTFSVASGAVTVGTTVSLTHATADEIRYTTDGVDPTTTTGTVYSAPIAITAPVTIKAIAVEGGVASSVVSATYTITVTTPTIIGGANVTITGDDGCTFYYTTATGGSTPADPDNNSTEYTAPFTPEDGTKIKAVAYDAYGNKSNVTAVFTFKYMPLAPKNYNTNFYVKVTDVNDLENGDAILIVCESDYHAMSTTQNSNNRGEASVTISGGIIDTPSEAVQKIVLVKKTEEIETVDTDVFYFFTGAAGYLYAASNGSNHLKTEATPDDNNNARATISISDGDATILFTGTYSRNNLRHNNSSSIFSCYASNNNQDKVQIYKEVLTSVDVTDANYATLVTAYDVDFTASTGVTAYKVAGTDGKIELEKVDAAPKGTPLIIAATENTYNLALATSEPEEVTGNKLKAADGNQTGDGAGNYYVLGKNTSGVVGFGPLANGVTLAKGKAYIDGAQVTAKDFLPFVIGGEENETTAIKAVETMETNGTAYNLAGQKVGKGYKGIVVVNGKKFVRK